jgi:basic membrane protein A
MKSLRIASTVFFAVLLFFTGPLRANDNDETQNRLKVSMVIPGPIDDGGFMESGYLGLLSIKNELGAEINYIDKLKPEMDLLTEAIRDLAKEKPDLIISHGGQTAKAMELVAPEFPDVKFSVTQGDASGANLTSYEVAQEQSAWLAGAAAGLLTKTGTVGHISAHRVKPGLKGRGAFADGLRATNPDAKFLTTFIGKQDDAALAKTAAKAQIEEGADIIFTMLSAERSGVTEACREAGIHQIGNVREWHKDHPDVFVASAVADVSVAPLRTAKDVADGSWKAGRIVKIGLGDSSAVRLALAPSVPADVVRQLDELTKKIKTGEIEISTEYQGEEFSIEP